jgi:Methylamine utilisation protein MauE
MMLGHWFMRVGLSVALLLLGLSKIQVLTDGHVHGHEQNLLPIVLGLVAGIELLVATLLLSKAWRIGAWSTACLGTAFLFAVPGMLIFGIQPSSCGCFGKWQLSTGAHILFAIGLFGLAAALLMDPQGYDCESKRASDYRET